MVAWSYNRGDFADSTDFWECQFGHCADANWRIITYGQGQLKDLEKNDTGEWLEDDEPEIEIQPTELRTLWFQRVDRDWWSIQMIVRTFDWVNLTCEELIYFQVIYVKDCVLTSDLILTTLIEITSIRARPWWQLSCKHRRTLCTAFYDRDRVTVHWNKSELSFSWTDIDGQDK